MPRKRYLFFSAAFAVLALFALSPSANAAIVIAPDVQVTVGVEGNTMTLSPIGNEVPGPGDLFNYDGSMSAPQWDLSWDMTVDPDPFVSGAFALTNVTAITQTYILGVSLPIAPAVTPSSLMGGSIGVTITDSNFDGVATVTSAAPTPIYQGQIDGGTVLPLMPDPFSISAPFAGGSASTSTSAGLPGPTIPGPAAFATIDILHRFTLTAGDSIGLTSFFVIEAVPEPTSLALGGLGLLALVGTRRRRR